MDKILVEVSIGELLDKLSILEIKKNKIINPEHIKQINKEFDILKLEYDNKVDKEENLIKLYNELKEINGKLWTIEDDKRLCEKISNFGDKFIRLSRDVHFLNDQRAKIKNQINDYTNSNIKEVKQYTSY